MLLTITTTTFPATDLGYLLRGRVGVADGMNPTIRPMTFIFNRPNILGPAARERKAVAAFGRLSRRLETSGFFSRNSGYVHPSHLFPGDVGHLMIKVCRRGRVTQVWSYNGNRDAELWATEKAIREAGAELGRLNEKHRTR